jgi:formate-dependent nitrite reductase cytochrome c552 subunit
MQCSVVHQYEMSMHARKRVNCLDCHQPAAVVQWHGNYPMLQKMAELKAMADELRRQHGRAK